MKFRNAYSTLGAGGSIPVNVQTHASPIKARGLKAVLAVAMLSMALFALPGQAFAGDPCNNPTDAQYAQGTQQCVAAGLGAGGGGGETGQPAQRVAVPKASSGPSLPFTGLDVAALAAVALALTGTGMVLRRLATNGDSQT
jgi:hypothetical protein